MNNYDVLNAELIRLHNNLKLIAFTQKDRDDVLRLIAALHAKLTPTYLPYYYPYQQYQSPYYYYGGQTYTTSPTQAGANQAVAVQLNTNPGNQVGSTGNR